MVNRGVLQNSSALAHTILILWLPMVSAYTLKYRLKKVWTV